MNAEINPSNSRVMRLGDGPDRLDSWKEIARYLKREVRTVQLWEKKEALPVHRHFHTHLGTVFAFRSEIEEWGRRQSARRLASVAQQAAGSQPAKIFERITVGSFSSAIEDPAHSSFCQSIVATTSAALHALDLAGQNSNTQSDFNLTWTYSEEPDGFALQASLERNESKSAVWSRTFSIASATTTPQEIVATTQEITDQIVQCLWLKVQPTSPSLPAYVHSEKTDSREAYLRGRYFLNRRDHESMRKAIGWFRKSIAHDVGFALPYSGLADSLTLLSFYEMVSPADAMPEARIAALRAIDLGPNLAEAHASLADIHLHFDRDWEAADQQYRRAIECNPRYAVGYQWYSNLLAAKGQHEAAQIAIMHALEIDPVSLITQVWAGVTSHLAHRFDDAIGHYQSALELDPNFTCAHMYMAQTLEQKGEYREALREFDTTLQLAGGSNCVTAMKAHAHAMAGEKSTARKMLGGLKSTTDRSRMPSYDIAAAYTALGDHEQAVSWLKRACGERNMKLFKLPQDPRFNPLRSLTEFREIMEHIGLARYSAH
jgi:tetratricopeptide (TPR) repeat protein